MTLTELQYIVALAQERHFGRAAERSFVTQPALSLAIKKLEDEQKKLSGKVEELMAEWERIETELGELGA